MKIDITNALWDSVGDHGLSLEDRSSVESELRDVHGDIQSDRGDGELGFIDAVENEDPGYINEVCDALSGFDSLVNVGIGGSSLGAEMLTSSLVPDAPVYFLDNVDPEMLESVLGEVELSETVFNVVSKSGETTETLVNFSLIRDALMDEGLNWGEHVLLTTGRDGRLREFEDECLGVIDFPVGVPGRYSALTRVGLVALGFSGGDVDGVLRGARRGLNRCMSVGFMDNPGYGLAGILYGLHEMRGKDICVFFPYMERMEALGRWFSQLWGESLGKRYDEMGKEVYAGLTPLRCIGVTDQHSLLQLFVEGPNDKSLVFLGFDCDSVDYELSGGDVFPEGEGWSYSEIRELERRATMESLAEANRPSVSLELGDVDEEVLGELVFVLMYSCVSLGYLLGIDPFSQPGVDRGKEIVGDVLRGEGGYSGIWEGESGGGDIID